MACTHGMHAWGYAHMVSTPGMHNGMHTRYEPTVSTQGTHETLSTHGKHTWYAHMVCTQGMDIW